MELFKYGVITAGDFFFYKSLIWSISGAGLHSSEDAIVSTILGTLVIYYW